MDLTASLIVNTYALSIILVLLRHTKMSGEQSDPESRIFGWMLAATAFVTVFEVMSCFEGKPESIYPIISRLGSFLFYLSYPFLPAIWLMYVHYKVNHDRPGLRQLTPVIAATLLANTALVIASQSSGWLYSVNAENRFIAGPGFIMPTVLSLLFLAAASYLAIANRHRLESRHFRAVLLFNLPPVITLLLKQMLPDISLMFGSISVSLLIVYANIQNQSLFTDYLTGANNRRRLEHYLSARIRTVATEGTFGAIMLDIDNFKRINDTLGHDAGDAALETAVRLVRGSLRSRDFVARYGGDEFYVILDGISMERDLHFVVDKIQTAARNHNESRRTPFRIEFSVGCAVYNPDSGMDMDHFLKHIDALMYLDKRQKQVGSVSEAAPETIPIN